MHTMYLSNDPSSEVFVGASSDFGGRSARDPIAFLARHLFYLQVAEQKAWGKAVWSVRLPPLLCVQPARLSRRAIASLFTLCHEPLQNGPPHVTDDAERFNVFSVPYRNVPSEKNQRINNLLYVIVFKDAANAGRLIYL
jgi:hypothetical protein